MKAVIPDRIHRSRRYRHDKTLYGQRNLIERCFGTLKRYRRIATRFDQNDTHFLSFLSLARSLLWLH
jgi:transposase